MTRERGLKRYFQRDAAMRGGHVPPHLQHGARPPITITTSFDAVNAHRQLSHRGGATSKMFSPSATRIVNVFVGRTDQAASSEPLDSPWINAILGNR